MNTTIVLLADFNQLPPPGRDKTPLHEGEAWADMEIFSFGRQLRLRSGDSPISSIISAVHYAEEVTPDHIGVRFLAELITKTEKLCEENGNKVPHRPFLYAAVKSQVC